mgnify:FL=1
MRGYHERYSTHDLEALVIPFAIIADMLIIEYLKDALHVKSDTDIEELILDRDTYAVKKEIGSRFASLVYEGKWFTPLREAEQAFIEKTQEYVTGEVKFKLYKGNIIKAGTTSPYSLYNESIASFTTGDLYDHHDADGFINLFGLSLKVRAMKHNENEKNL